MTSNHSVSVRPSGYLSLSVVMMVWHPSMSAQTMVLLSTSIAVVAPDGPIRIDRDALQAVLGEQIANLVGVVVDGNVGRETKPFEEIKPRGRGQLDIFSAQLLNPGETLFRAPPFGTPVVGAEGKFQAHGHDLSGL